MAILKIKATDAAGQPIAGQAVKVTGCGELQTGAGGVAQFLVEDDALLEIEINGVLSWAGSASTLGREEVFNKTATGFVRATGA